MKKQLLLLAMILLPLVASAHDIEVKNADGVTIYYNYFNDGKELAVSFRGDKYDSYSKEYTGNVVIPDEVTYMNRTRKVTSIVGYAFHECSDLTSVTIPNSVTSIGRNAFSRCYGLTSVTIPNSVTSIAREAFQSCVNLTSITIGNGVTNIGNNAFFTCSDLKKVIASDIPAWCGIQFGDQYSNPLCYAHHIYSDEKTEIMDLVIPNSVTSIGKSAFNYCHGLTSVTIPNSVTSIGDDAFRACISLTSVTIGSGVTSIGNNAFQYCSGLTFVTIPNSVTSIGSLAFESCEGLTSAIIGSGVTNIGNSAFTNCSKLTSVVIPNSVTSIGSSAFYHCSGLTSITIGSGVTSIGSQAFDGADIPTIISLIENPIAIYGKNMSTKIFTLNTYNNATLFVPKGTIDKYKATDGWKDFLFIEEGVPSGIKGVHLDNDKDYPIYDINGRRLEAPQRGINIINGKKVIMK